MTLEQLHAERARTEARIAATRERLGPNAALVDPDNRIDIARLGDLDVQEEELERELKRERTPQLSTPPGRELREILLRALKVNEPEGLRRIRISRHTNDAPRRQSPRWPSGITAVQGMSGGFYGFTALGGPRKAGKTTIAMGSALSAAERGWSVWYFAGENTDANLEELAHAWLGSQRAYEHPDWLLERFHLQRFGRRASLGQLVHQVANHTWADTEHVLIVLDSVNTLARAASAKQGDYLRELEAITSWARSATEESAGRIGVLALSEENSKGGLVGQQIEYAAACLLQVEPRKRNPDKLGITLTSRESPGGFCGTHERVREECRLRPIYGPDQEQPEERTAATGELPW